MSGRYRSFHEAVPRCARCRRVLDLEDRCPECDKFACSQCGATSDAAPSVAHPCLFCKGESGAERHIRKAG